MKILDIIFHEDTIGFTGIGMMLLACIYVRTDSAFIQMIGLWVGFMILILLIGFTLKNIIIATKQLKEYLKK